MTTKARSGETGTGSTEGESPSGKAGAPECILDRDEAVRLALEWGREG